MQAPPPSPCQRARGVLPQGFLYVLDHRGAAKPGWPVQMGEIQGQPAAADVNGDGEMEIIAADTKGNVAAFTHRGLEVWERHLASLVAQAPSLPFLPASFAGPHPKLIDARQITSPVSYPRL